MGDVNLGTIYTQIDLDTDLLDQRVAEVVDIWRDMQKSTEKEARQLNRTMLTGAKEYQRELEKIEEQLERQRSVMAQLQEMAGRSLAGPDVAAEAAQIAEQLEVERNKLQNLENQYYSASDAMREFAAEQDKFSAKELAGGQGSGAKSPSVSAGSGASTSTSELLTLGKVIPSISDSTGDLIKHIVEINEAMGAGRSATAAWGGAITTGISIAATAVTALITYFQELKEKQQQAFEEGIQKSQEYAESIPTLERNLSTLSNASSSMQDVRTATEAVANAFPDLILGYDNEGKAILANNDAIEEQIELYKQKQAAARQDVIDNGEMYSREAESLREQIAALKEDIARDQELAKKSAAELYAENPYETELSVKERLASENAEIEKKKQLLGDVETKEQQYNRYTIEGRLKVTEANGKVVTGIENMSQEYQVAVRSMEQELHDLIEGELSDDQMQSAADRINAMLGDPREVQRYTSEWEKSNAEAQKQADLMYILTEQYGQQEATMGDLSSAYQKLSSGAALTKEELQKLAQTFPSINAYLEETGDRSLNSGQLIADAMGEINYDEQITELGDLASAYEKLSSGQQLSVGQLYDLAAAYPEVAAYLQQTGDTTLKNGEILKDLFEIRRKAHIQELEENREGLISAKNTTLAEIELIQAKITAYGAINKVRSGSLDEGRYEQRITKELAAEFKKSEDLQAQIDAANAMINAAKSDAASIGNFNGGSKNKGTSTSKKSSSGKERSEELAKELELLDHESKMERINDEEKLVRLKKLQEKYQEYAKDRTDMEYRVFSLEKQINEATEQAVQDKLDTAYDEIDNKKKMQEMSSQLAKEELDQLKELREQYHYIPEDQTGNLTKEEREYLLTKEQELDLDYRIHQAEEQLAEAREKASQKMLDSVEKDFAHRAAMGEDVTQQELAALEEIQRKAEAVAGEHWGLLTEDELRYQLTAEQKMDLDEKVYSLREKLRKAEEEAEQNAYSRKLKRIQNQVSLGQLSTEEEIKELKNLKRKYKENKDIQMELEIKLYNLKKQLHQEEVAAVDSLGDVLVEALRNRYEEQRKTEQDRINESIEGWQKWEEETVSAIQGQIDALDELDKKEESDEKRREYERKKQALSLQLAYEKDDYQRKQYQQELARLEEEEQKRLDDEAREAERKRLEEEMKKAQEESQKQQDALKDQLDKVNEEYDKMTSDFQLRAEAEKAIMANTQKEIVELIKAYAPEYDLAGQSIGEKLADGFKRKFGNVLDYVQSITEQISNYQQTLIDQANAAADKFYQTHQGGQTLPQPPASLAAARETKPVQVTVNFNQPVESPVETRRAIESVMNEIARQIG